MTITVTCNLVDDLGQTAKATTDVIITAPVVPVPQTQQLCSLSFTRDRRRPVRVDNEAKGCLDDIALTLTQQTDAHLVMVGNSTPDEKPEAAAERALNARQYLVQEKGIDPTRVELRIGASTGEVVTNTLVPAGATFNNPDTHTFDEKTIVRHGQAYGTPRYGGTSRPRGAAFERPAPAPAAPAGTAPAIATPAPTDQPAAPTPAAAPATSAPAAPAVPVAAPLSPAALAPAPGATAPATAAPETQTTPPVSTTQPAPTSSSAPQ
jgi:hypothetical protein